jgi:hypothetical protein
MQARAHFKPPPLHTLVVARGGLPGTFAVTRNGPSCQSQGRQSLHTGLVVPHVSIFLYESSVMRRNVLKQTSSNTETNI